MTDIPELDEMALHGFAGEIVKALLPTTEAAPAALLVTLLAAAGAYVGNGPHAFTGDSKHPARIWPLIIGKSGAGRKGTSYSCVERLLVEAVPDFVTENILSGLSSGEGLIANLRDAEPDEPGSERPQGKGRPHPGVIDKRRLVVESEFGALLGRKNRDGNTLSPMLRDAWDGRPLATITKADPQKATGTHIVVIGHITPKELRNKVPPDDLTNGFLNRFLPFVVERSKLLASRSSASQELVQEFGTALRRRLELARGVGRVEFTEGAAKLWDDGGFYNMLNEEDEDDQLDALSARGPVQVLRIALCFVLLDGRQEIAEDDLMAAYALWDLSCRSAKYVFGVAPLRTDLDKLRAAVKAAGSDGLSRAKVGSQVFSNHKSAEEMDRLLQQLVELPDFEQRTEETAGRSARIYFFTG